MLSTLTHTHSPPPLSFKHFSSVFSQWCRIKLCPQRRQHRDGLSFLGFLGPTSKTQRLKLGISEQLESLFNYICGLQACHQCVTLLVQTPECCLLRGSQTGVKPMEAGVSNQNVHGDFAGLGTTLVTFTTNNWRSGKTIQWTEKKKWVTWAKSCWQLKINHKLFGLCVWKIWFSDQHFSSLKL